MNPASSQHITAPVANMASAIYEGTIRHHRLRPRAHIFNYRVFMMYLDLDELDAVFSLSPWWSASHYAPAQFRRSDFIGPSNITTSQAVRDCVHEATGAMIDGPIRLLCNLRYFGFMINPISCYYCFDHHENLRYIVAEVTNTPWKEKIHYVIPCSQNSPFQRHQFQKCLHVSPFMPMQMTYHWKSKTPDSSISIHLENWSNAEQVFSATLSLQRVVLSRKSMNRILLRFPLMTLKVAGAIHWQALRLFLKKTPLFKHRFTAPNKH